MKNAVALLLLAVSITPAWADPAVDALSQCFSENTTGKDRKTMAKWLFVSMGAHPEMRAIASITPTSTEVVSKDAAELLTKLLVQACPKQTQAAVRAAGAPAAMQGAFAVIGQLAMQELMTDKGVVAAMGVLQTSLDNEEVRRVLSPR
jgi:hypothetical protein